MIILNLLTRSFIFSLITNLALLIVKFVLAFILTAMYQPDMVSNGEEVYYLQSEVVIGGNFSSSYITEFIVGFIVVMLVYLLGYKLKLIK